MEAPIRKFEAADGEFLRDERGQITGGVTLDLVAEPIADFSPSQNDNPLRGTMHLHSKDSILERYPSVEAYYEACDVHDDALEKAGYLEKTGRRLLRNVEAELWERAVNGAPAPQSSPQSVA